MGTVSLPEIETERLILRQLTTDDLDDWTRHIFADAEVVRYLPARPATPHERAKRTLQAVRRNWAAHGYSLWALTAKDDGRFLGHCGLNYLAETDEVEVEYALAKSWWGQGLGTEAARASLRFGFEAINLARIIALAFPENIASRRVMEHIGLQYQKQARYFELDLVCYALTREQYQVDPLVFYRQRL
jgi:ribosomal-protein-alanine N-acetyltransferase